MRVAISQPTYLPWLGYFDLIDQCDQFVFLDSVQFEKRSWQQRNRVKGPNGLILLSVPVKVRGRFEQAIADVEVADVAEWQKHKRSMEMNYRRARFFDAYWDDFCRTLESSWMTGNLADLNTSMIRWCMRQMGIEKPLWRSSTMDCRGKKGALLAEICERLQANDYISVPGAAGYLLEEEHEFAQRNVEIQFQQFEHPEYEQQFMPFAPYASTVDLIFNLGNKAVDVLRSGRRASISADHMREMRLGAATN